ncbi:hypothetical protein ACF065_18410 [Streptomyces sp. NPDC015232]|uniref:hypothetical protein n=1 Tax=unclassified Streptomyces TaxID=2593676 RepID=UPI0037026CDE
MSTWGGWALLAGAAVLLLLPSLAVLAGWRPGRLRYTRAPVRLLAAAGLAGYAAVLADEVPDLAGAPGEVRSVCAYIGLGFIAAAVVLVVRYDVLAGRSRPDGR